MTNSETTERQLVFSTQATEAAGLYRMITSLSSGALGLSLVVIRDIAPSPPESTKVLAGLGWLLLLVSLATTLHIRFDNLRSAHAVLAGKNADAERLDGMKMRCTFLAGVSLILGIAMLMAFAWCNL